MCIELSVEIIFPHNIFYTFFQVSMLLLRSLMPFFSLILYFGFHVFSFGGNKIFLAPGTLKFHSLLMTWVSHSLQRVLQHFSSIHTMLGCFLVNCLFYIFFVLFLYTRINPGSIYLYYGLSLYLLVLLNESSQLTFPKCPLFLFTLNYPI